MLCPGTARGMYMPRLQQAKASGSSESEQAVEDRGARLEDAEVGLMHKVVRDHQARGRRVVLPCWTHDPCVSTKHRSRCISCV